MDIPSSYVQAVKESASVLVPFATLGPVLEAAGKVTYEEQLGYSVVHLGKDGKYVADLKACAFVAMPHVIARGNDKGLASIMKQAGFTKEGLCKGRNEVVARQAEAARLGAKLWSMFGTKPVPKAPKAPKAKVEVPAEEATAQPAS
jgi:hypothetical protein